jgi:hypothetical protein
VKARVHDISYLKVPASNSPTHKLKKKLNSVALVRKRTISTDRPPLVGEVSANFRLHTPGIKMNNLARNQDNISPVGIQTRRTTKCAQL